MKNKNESVPKDGAEAFHSAYGPKHNPWPWSDPRSMWWLSDWWRANALAFESHINGGVSGVPD